MRNLFLATCEKKVRKTSLVATFATYRQKDGGFQPISRRQKCKSFEAVSSRSVKKTAQSIVTMKRSTCFGSLQRNLDYRVLDGAFWRC